MHIAQFTNFYHPVVNGVVRSISLFRQALTESGHNVFIFAQHAPDYEDPEPFIFRYPAIPVPAQVDLTAAIPIAPYIDKVLPILKVQVVHTHHPFLLGQVAANKAEELGVPLVFTFHTRYRDYTHYFPLPQDFVQDFIKNAVDTWLGDFMEGCHHIIVPSRSMFNLLQEGYGLEEQVTVVPTGIDLAPYQRVDRDLVRKKFGWDSGPVLVSVGRLAPEKNIATLLQAAALVMPDHPDLQIALVGDGPSRNELAELADELRIGNRVTFLGTLPFDQVPEVLLAADVFGFASITETQGLVTMEALAAGLPVAAVHAPGTADVVREGVDGFLVENSPEALAAAIRTLLDQPETRSAMGRAARERAREFDIRALSQRLIGVYEQAIEDRAAGRTVKLRKPKLFNIDWKLFPSLH